MSKVISKRTRSFGGCVTCRSRRIKCDQAKPECHTCRKAGLTCGLYETSLIFESRDEEKSQKLRFRRPVLSLRERARMSERIVASVPPHLALWSLAQIEEHCEKVSSLSKDINILRGPFGVFKLGFDEVNTAHDDTWAMELERAPTYEDSNQSGLEPLHATPWLTTSDVPLGENEIPNNEGLWVPDTYIQLGGVDELTLDTVTDNHAAGMEDHQSQTWFQGPLISQTPSIHACCTSGFLQTACALLKHYTNTVLKSLTPFSHSKTPWHILFVPLVKNCLAGLALQEDLDAASLCVFYGTLTMSSLSFNTTLQSGGWSHCTELYRRKGHENLLGALKTAYFPQKTAKYKNQLMACLTMVQLSIARGKREETESFLLEAEQLIRVRGLNRKKSRKIRLLHHYYAYERILFESTTHYYGRTVANRRDIRKAIEVSGAMSYSQDSLSFKFRNSGNLESEMLKLKTQEEGENDLHLEIPGHWPPTLYPEIFGVPEIYVLLVSMIIRLAREKGSEDYDDDIGQRLSLKDFTDRAKSIESCIKEQQHRLPPGFGDDVSNLVEAVHQAVTIYFYRRIYDVDPSMLREQVSQVRKVLAQNELQAFDKGRGSLRWIWPAFIAASETDDPESREFFTGWFGNAARQSGLHVFQSNLENIRESWEKREQRNTVFSLDDIDLHLEDEMLFDQINNDLL